MHPLRTTAKNRSVASPPPQQLPLSEETREPVFVSNLATIVSEHDEQSLRDLYAKRDCLECWRSIITWITHTFTLVSGICAYAAGFWPSFQWLTFVAGSLSASILFGAATIHTLSAKKRDAGRTVNIFLRAHNLPPEARMDSPSDPASS